MTRAGRVWTLCVSVCLLTATGAFGCNCSESDTSPQETPELIEAAPILGLEPSVAERRLALVDGEAVTVLDLARELEEASPAIAARQVDPDARLAVLEAMLVERALAAEARDRGHAEDPTVVRASEQLYVRALASQIASEVPQPSQEAVRAVFDLQRSRYRTPELRAVGLIFTRDRAAAEQALTALLAGDQRQAPQEWMRAAERIGFAGPRRQPREETEFFAALPRDGEAFVAQPVRDAAFETEPGAIHPALVPYDDGFYIVRVSSRAEPTDISFEEAAPRIRAELHEEAVDSAVTQLIAERLAAATYDDAALEAVVVPAEASAP